MAVLARLAEFVDMFTAGAHRVDVMLDNARRDHGERGQGESSGDLLNGREVDAHLPEPRVYNEVHDRDDDDDEDGVELGDDVVGCAAEVHGVGLRDEVVCHLVVGEPVEGVPEENLAGDDTTLDLVDPGIVKGHPGGNDFAASTDAAGLDALPKVGVLEGVLLGAGFESKADQLGGAAHDGSGGRGQLVVSLEENEERGAEQVADGRERVGEPETDEVLRVHHGDGTGEGTAVDQEVKVDVDAGCGGGRIDDFFGPVLPDTDVSLLVLVLLSDEG